MEFSIFFTQKKHLNGNFMIWQRTVGQCVNSICIQRLVCIMYGNSLNTKRKKIRIISKTFFLNSILDELFSFKKLKADRQDTLLEGGKSQNLEFISEYAKQRRFLYANIDILKKNVFLKIIKSSSWTLNMRKNLLHKELQQLMQTV